MSLTTDADSSRPPSAGNRQLRLLWIHPAPVPPHPDAPRNALYHLGKRFTGDVLTTSWLSRSEYRSARQSYPSLLGGFGYHAALTNRLPALIRLFAEPWFYLTRGLFLSWRLGRYDAIIAYGPFKTSLVAMILKWIVGSPLIVEVPGNPFRGFAFEASWMGRIKERLAHYVVPFVLRHADHVHLLYPDPMVVELVESPEKLSIFHDFVPVSLLTPSSTPPLPYILFLGYPWTLKGVDILIQAFQQIAERHPSIRLRIVGHCPDRTEFEALVNGHPQISLEKAVHHPEAMALMANCLLFVLPSRTEAMGRVLLEAMALGKPVVASAVDGIPTYVEDCVTGLLFPSEDIEALARCLDRVLCDPALAAQLASAGYHKARERYTEKRYVEQVERMVLSTLSSTPSSIDP